MKNNNINNLFNMINMNLKTFVKFELLYKLILSVIFIPVSVSSFNMVLNITGIDSLSNNILQLITNPTIIIFFIIMLALVILITLFEISTIIVIQDIFYHNKKITLKEALTISIFKFENIFKNGNIQNIFYFILLSPFINISVITSFLLVIGISTSVIKFITINKNILIIALLLYFLLIALLSDRLFTMHYTIIEDLDAESSKKKSNKLIKNKEIKDYLKILASQFILTATSIGFITIGSYILPFITTSLNNIKFLANISDIIPMFIIVLFFIVLQAMSNGLSFTMISYLFYTHKKAKKERIYKLNYKTEYSTIILKRLIKCTAGTLVVVLGLLLYANQNSVVVKRKPIAYSAVKNNIEVTAHRGASIVYPENTIAAFKGAVAQNADWIEIDIRQTSDNYLVVTHNPNLVATTGVDREVNQLTLEEIKSLDAGFTFNPRFLGEKIPTFEEAIEFAKENNIRLNIEVKVTGLESNLEQQIVDTIEKYDFEDNCIVSSFVTDILKKVKGLNGNIKTAAIATENINEDYTLPYIDAYSVDALYINREVVASVHGNNKKIYAWTINDEEKINEMINLGVDNIVTDDVSLAKLLIADREMNAIMNIK